MPTPSFTIDAFRRYYEICLYESGQRLVNSTASRDKHLVALGWFNGSVFPEAKFKEVQQVCMHRVRVLSSIAGVSVPEDLEREYLVMTDPFETSEVS